MDGTVSTSFSTIDEAATYIRQRWMGIDYMDSSWGFHNDYGQFTTHGFSLRDIGKTTMSGEVRDFVFEKGEK